MAEIVNLRVARKRKARAGKEQTAASNRVLFGRSHTEREEARIAADLEARRHEAHRLSRQAPDGDHDT
jgi:ABC-type phosphate transport system auxiliary subunit